MRILILISLLFFFLGCKKSTNGKIFVTKFYPEIELTSVDTIVNLPSCISLALPADSSSTILLDIDKDGVNDFDITCLSWYNFVSASSPCSNYQKSIMISGLNENNFVAIEGDYFVVKAFDLDQEIEKSENWSNFAYFMKLDQGLWFSANLEGEMYVGLKFEKQFKKYYAWLYIEKIDYKIIIKSYAFRNKSGKTIKAGQTE